jgi:hypothetical protein
MHDLVKQLGPGAKQQNWINVQTDQIERLLTDCSRVHPGGA